ncbi:MAG: DUF3836 domain-containing protein [Bacteroidota bacterium]
MKTCIWIILLVLSCAITAHVNAQVVAELSPCPGYTNNPTANNKSAATKIDAHFKLLQSDLTPAEKTTCLVTAGLTTQLNKQSQADGLLYTVEYQGWDSVAWIPSNQDMYVYDANGHVASRTRRSWNSDTQSYSTARSRTSYTYDAQGRILTVHGQSWDDDAQEFAIGSRSELTWSDAGELLTTMSYGWQNGDWILAASLERTFENGVATKELSKRRDVTTGLLTNYIRVLLAYDDQQRVIERIDQQWDIERVRWQNSVRSTISYAGFTRTSRGDLYNNDAWQPIVIHFTLYNEQFQILEETNALAGSDARPLGRHFYTYNTQGYLIEKRSEFFDPLTEMWRMNARIIYEVDADGDILESRWQELDLLLQALVNTARVVHTYAPAVGIAGERPGMPFSFNLYPNPAPNHVTVEVSLDQPMALQIAIFDLLGRRISILVDTPLATGLQRFVWTPTELPASTYFVRLQTDSDVSTHAVTLMK